jgi:hypothetical protein
MGLVQNVGIGLVNGDACRLITILQFIAQPSRWDSGLHEASEGCSLVETEELACLAVCVESPCSVTNLISLYKVVFNGCDELEVVARQECLVFVKTNGSLLKLGQCSDTSFPERLCHIDYQNICPFSNFSVSVDTREREETAILKIFKYADNEKLVRHSLCAYRGVEERFVSLTFGTIWR